jgi:AcrR family transcriptional regulator
LRINVEKVSTPPASGTGSRRLSKAERRRQLLQTALLIVREENADRLTLGHLAVRAGVSKPVVYDHFSTRSALLIELYRWIDTERVDAFRNAMASSPQTLEETAQVLASAYIHCAADHTDEFHVVGAALAGSSDKAAVFQELLDNCVRMFIAVLEPHAGLSSEEMERVCTALVGAGEALSGATVRGRHTVDEAIDTLSSLIRGAFRR